MHPKRFTLLTLSTALLLATGAAQADREAHRPQGHGPFEFALIGDTPYLSGSNPGAD